MKINFLLFFALSTSLPCFATDVLGGQEFSLSVTDHKAEDSQELVRSEILSPLKRNSLDQNPQNSNESLVSSKSQSNSNFINAGLDRLLYNDVRDVAKYDEDLYYTSNRILDGMVVRASEFAGQDVLFHMENAPGSTSPIGPSGSIGVLPDAEKPTFVVSDHNSDRRRNLILSATYEKILKHPSKSIYDIDLMLFIHSDEKGYFFRQINIICDWVNLVDENMNLEFVRVIREIPLHETDFEIRVELSSQKTILRDKSQHGILKVMPVTAGAIDARTLKSPDLVNSMTLLLPNTGSEIKYKDFELNESYLVKRDVWEDSSINSSSRVFPSGYYGRPFLSIIDESLMPRKENGALKTFKMNGSRFAAIKKTNPRTGQVDWAPIEEAAGRPYYPGGYRQIGFHFQIDTDRLHRGFESHGCLRLQDHDLYLIDAILNSGPKERIPVEVKMVLSKKFEFIDSVYKREKKYKKVLYSDKHSTSGPKLIKCKGRPSYPVRMFVGSDGKTYHTLADSGCLTRTDEYNSDLDHVVDVLKGQSRDHITTMFKPQVEHSPVAIRQQTVRDNPEISKQIRSTRASWEIPFIEISQDEQIEIVEMIESCKRGSHQPYCLNTTPTIFVSGGLWSRFADGFSGNITSATQNLQIDRAELSTLRSKLRKHRDRFNRHCAHKLKGQTDPRQKCEETNKYLRYYGVR